MNSLDSRLNLQLKFFSRTHVSVHFGNANAVCIDLNELLGAFPRSQIGYNCQKP